MSRPKPTAIRRLEGNPGGRGYNHDEPVPPDTLPDCPAHLNDEAKAEWQRIAQVLHDMGVVTMIDRAVLSAYCQCYGRWVEAEEKLRVTPMLLKTKTGYVQQSPWLSIANRQMELMGRYMAELGLTPSARSKITTMHEPVGDPVTSIKFVTVYADKDGTLHREPTGFSLEAEHTLPAPGLDDENGRMIERPLNRGGTALPQEDRAPVTQYIIPDNNR